VPVADGLRIALDHMCRAMHSCSTSHPGLGCSWSVVRLVPTFKTVSSGGFDSRLGPITMADESTELLTDYGNGGDEGMRLLNSNECLLEGFCAGDEQHASDFVRHFSRRLHRLAFRIVGDSGSAEDVVQMTFERVWRNGSVFDTERGSLDAWVSTIARNLALDWVRVKRETPIDTSETAVSPSSEVSDPERRSVIDESRREVRAVLARLPTAQARSVLLAVALDMSAAQVALHESVPLGTAKTRIRAGKQRLRRELTVLM
jgi:RNA polymerase sigma factor (sigma-70 family)